MTQVKICGVRRVEDALVAAAAGADMLGFVFAPSRRRIVPEVARVIIEAVRHLYPEVHMVGVFVDERPAELERVIDICRLDLIQLGGREPDGTVAALRLPVIRTVHVYPEHTRSRLSERLERMRADVILLDTGKVGSRGGTGERFDWDLVPETDRPVMLAGGLTPENVREAVDRLHPWGVDVSSGVERNGEKDATLIRRFTRAVTCEQRGGSWRMSRC